MIGRLFTAGAAGVIAFLLCLLVGTILEALGVPLLKQVGGFLEQWAVVIGVIAFVFAFFTSWSPFNRGT